MGTAIVLRQNNNGGLAKSTFKLVNIAQVRTTELVNALVAIAHHAYVLIQFSEQQHNAVLRLVGVLIFVNQDVLKALLVNAKNLWVLLKETHHIHQEVIEIHCTRTLEAQLILGINLRMATHDDVLCTIVCTCRCDEFVLPQTDTRLCSASWVLLDIKAHVANDISD